MTFLRRRPDLILVLAGVLLVIAGVAIYLTSPDHDFGFVMGAPFNLLLLLSGQQKTGLAVGGAGALLLAFGAGTGLGLRLARATKLD
ncbi:hypothetical protein AAIH25_12655 [Arthrobacter crystallopoietes]|uniref:hypothetical protein n=1 Tax=Crystallibacter crystallopoietes TaxID=37928 RepID=UPI003D20D2BB